MSKKRRIPMRVRRRIFAGCCIVLVCIIFALCMKGCSDDTAVGYDMQTVVADSIPITETPTKNGRYSDLNIESWELDEMASIIYLEARNQSAKGQQAVAEVILNRALHDGFPNSISGVIHEGEAKGVVQFTTVYNLSTAMPGAEQYKAINAALYGEPILPVDVVFFSRDGENDNVWGKIGDHIFCYAYNWE